MNTGRILSVVGLGLSRTNRSVPLLPRCIETVRSMSTNIESKPANPEKGARSAPKSRIAPIALTTKAAARINQLIAQKEDTVGVHLSVKRRGCNGYSYIMNYATKDMINSKADEMVQAHGVTVLVDPKAVFFIVGTTMDYNETELASEFTFINPNSKGECGCGESFNV